MELVCRWAAALAATTAAFGQPVGSPDPSPMSFTSMPPTTAAGRSSPSFSRSSPQISPVQRSELSVWPPPQLLAAAGPPRLVDDLIAITAADVAAASNPVLSAGIDRHRTILRAAANANHTDHTTEPSTVAQLAGALQQLHVRLEQPAVTELSFTPAGLGATDYSYELVFDRSSPTANLTAHTAFGALYGLETFTQLLLQNPRGGLRLGASAVRIRDTPAYSWRGLMIDAGRRFWPVSVVKNTLDTMAAVKLNVLHLHASDHCRWAVESKLFPQLTANLTGAFAGFYTQDDIKELVAYAKARGIRIVPEFDLPAHARGLLPLDSQTGGSGTVQFCQTKDVGYQRRDQLFDSDTTLATLASLLGEMSELFGDPVLNIGGDETFTAGPCNPNTTKRLQQFLCKTITEGMNKTVAGWEELLFDNNAAPPHAIIQAWGGYTPPNITARGRYAINSVSHHFYTGNDDGHGKVCFGSAAWARAHYNIAENVPADQKPLLIGGEMALWTDAYCPTLQCGAFDGPPQPARAMFPPAEDAAFGKSVGGILWPWGFVGAGSLWNYDAALDPQSAAFVARIYKLNDQLAARGSTVCPSHCNCTELAACGKPYVEHVANVPSPHKSDDVAARNVHYIPLSSGAACLDGSPVAYWISPGDPSVWTITLPGGGWCYNAPSCAGRAKSALGSSINVPNQTNVTCYQRDPSSGKPRNCTAVAIQYCDGASFSGLRSHAMPIHGGPRSGLHFRGLANLDAGLDVLFAQHGLQAAKEVLITGGSAGGMAVFLHADRIAARIRSSAPAVQKLVAVPEVGFFLDHGAISKKPTSSFTYHAKVMYSMQNMSAGLSRRCLAANPAAPYLCFLAPHMAAGIRTPLFMLQSRFDEWQLHNILQAPCVPSRPWYNASKCTNQEAQAILGYGADFDHQFAPLRTAITAKNSQHGGFVTTCMCHGCPWDRLQQLNTNAFTALGKWYYNVTEPGNSSFYFDGRGPNGNGELKNPKYRDPGHVNWCWPGDGAGFPPTGEPSHKSDDIGSQGWEAAAFVLLDRDGDGSVSIGEAAEGYFTAGQEPGLWRRDSINHSGLRDKWHFSCLRSVWRSDKDPAGLVDCAAFGSRLLLLDGIRTAAATLPFSEVFDWWQNVNFGVSLDEAIAAIPTAPTPVISAVSAANRLQTRAWILISSDWHIEPWYAGDALTTQPKFWRKGEGVVRFANASLKNMMRCADGTTGRHSLPCVLTGKDDPPIEHIATHFEKFQELHPRMPADETPNSFFFGGDTQAHLMNFTNQDSAPGSSERKKYNPLPGGLEWSGFAPSYQMAPAVATLMTNVLMLVLRHFDARHVYWGAGNHDGPEDKTFCSDDPSVQAVSLAWARPLVAAGIVDNALNRSYDGGADEAGARLDQVGFFLRTGYYVKLFAALPAEKLFVIVTNTNLGMSNARQNIAFAADLAWVAAQGGRAYIIGHHPQIVGCLNEHGLHDCGGDRFIPTQYRHIVRGVFAGHIHTSDATNMSSMFTQVGSVDQAGSDTFFVANVSAQTADFAIIVDPNSQQHVAYDRSKAGSISNASNWHQVESHPSPPPQPPPQPTPPSPAPPGPTSWECHKNMDNHDTLSKPPYHLKDTDIEHGVADVQGCQQQCNVSSGCLVIVWHGSDRHCHVLTGALTHAQFVATLKPDPASDKGVACFNTGTQPTPPSPSPSPLALPSLFLFLVIADWGGLIVAPYVTHRQTALGLAMEQYALAQETVVFPHSVGLSHVVAAGDNFYDCGISCGYNCNPPMAPGHKQDPEPNCTSDTTCHRFTDTFENVYSGLGLQVPFLAVAGNHDHHGNVTAQIEYSNVSERWWYPDYWYSVTHDVHRGSSSDLIVQTLMIDTTILVGDFEPYDKRPPVTAEAQWAWIEHELNASTADFLFVSGHYPMFSGCEHGSTALLLSRLKPMLESYNVTAYLSGHDHCAEHFVESPDRPAYIVSGAGRECCYTASQADMLPPNITKFAYWKGACPSGAVCPDTSGGASAFAAVHINDTEAVTVYYDSNLKLLYRSEPMHARSRSQRARNVAKTDDISFYKIYYTQGAKSWDPAPYNVSQFGFVADNTTVIYSFDVTKAAPLVLKTDEGPELGGFKLGNQFAVCVVTAAQVPVSAVQCAIPWRRRAMAGQCVGTAERCEYPAKSDTAVTHDVIVIVDGNKTVKNRVLVNKSFAEGVIVFEPIAGVVNYSVFYAPFTRPRNWDAVLQVTYTAYNKTADTTWARSNAVDPASIANGRWKALPHAHCGGVEATDAYNQRTELEMAATPAEVDALKSKAALMLFAEERTSPIRMLDALPISWVQKGPTASFQALAEPDEFRVFQVGAFAAERRLDSVTVRATLTSSTGDEFTTTCFNTEGVSADGEARAIPLSIEKNSVVPLWFGINIPRHAAQGDTATGQVFVTANGVNATMFLRIVVNSSTPIREHGDLEVWRMSRIRWLNSQRFQGEVSHGFDPITFQLPVGQDRAATVRTTHSTITLGPTGLPAQVVTGTGGKVLASNAAVQVNNCSSSEWQCSPTRFLGHSDAAVSWQTICQYDDMLTMTTSGTAEYDGYMNYSFTLEQSSPAAMKLSDVRLQFPLLAENSQFSMGINRRGSYRPTNSTVDWTWGTTKRQNFMVWLGSATAGLRLKLRGSDTTYRPDNLVTDKDYFDCMATPETAGASPIAAPKGGIAPWGQQGVGGMRYSDVNVQDDTVMLEAYTGARTLAPNTKMTFSFDLVHTPAKPVDIAGHWARRRIHLNSDWDHDFDKAADMSVDSEFLAAMVPIVDAWLATGANILEMHQGSTLMPWINAPLDATVDKRLGQFIQLVHNRSADVKDVRVKSYFSISTGLSARMNEIWLLHALNANAADRNGEIMKRGSGGGYSFLQEHLSNYTAGYHTLENGPGGEGPGGVVDGAVEVFGWSRLQNWYVEGCSFLARHLQLDGLYLDGIMYSRTTMRRARKALEDGRGWKHVVIDQHDGQEWNDANISNALMFMQHYAWIDTLWYGEGFNYSADSLDGHGPDWWLLEVSGIPFGLTGEMLEEGGGKWSWQHAMPYRGMVYGLTGRQRDVNTTGLWAFWDEIQIENMRMQGWWQPDCPVRLQGCPDVVATVYNRSGLALIALASWHRTRSTCTFDIEWSELGLKQGSNPTLEAPFVDLGSHGINGSSMVQERATFSAAAPFVVVPGGGALLVLRDADAVTW